MASAAAAVSTSKTSIATARSPEHARAAESPSTPIDSIKELEDEVDAAAPAVLQLLRCCDDGSTSTSMEEAPGAAISRTAMRSANRATREPLRRCCDGCGNRKESRPSSFPRCRGGAAVAVVVVAAPSALLLPLLELGLGAGSGRPVAGFSLSQKHRATSSGAGIAACVSVSPNGYICRKSGDGAGGAGPDDGASVNTGEPPALLPGAAPSSAATGCSERDSAEGQNAARARARAIPCPSCDLPCCFRCLCAPPRAAALWRRDMRAHMGGTGARSICVNACATRTASGMRSSTP